ncbi:MAG TPA: hypothetical protein VF690_12545, partial [Hymenobacter sp.]|jgi:hypothetical protein
MVNLLLFAPTQPGVKDPQGKSVGEAVESCFPDSEDGAQLLWNGVVVHLSYKYDLSIVIHDVVDLVRHVRTCARGDFDIAWPSNTFHTTWQVATADGRVRITACWYCVRGVAESLNAAPVAEATRADFLAQWVALLRLANRALVDTGYTPGELADWEPLITELAHHE